MSELDSNNKDLKFKAYLFERKLLVDAFQYGFYSFDKAILSLSSGAIGLSLIFLGQIDLHIEPGTLRFLISSWVCFCVCIICTLISFVTSRSGYYKEIEELNERFYGKQSSQYGKAHISDRSFIWTKWLNRISLVAFPIGVILLAIFSIANLLP